MSTMELKKFYRIAKEELLQLHEAEPLDFRLEQVEREKAADLWNVVVSYLVENKNAHEFMSMHYERIYKLLKIDDHHKVVSLHIFEH